MDTRRKVYRYLVVGLAVALLAVGGTAAYAQAPTPSSAAADLPVAHRGWGGPIGSESQDPLLAEALGIGVEELQDAQAAAKESALADAERLYRPGGHPG